MLKFTQEMLKAWIPPLNAVIITDLDGCAVDSSHRQHCLPNGQLDLKNWREHCSEFDIMGDILTPWGERIAELQRKRVDLTFAVCTSRVVNEFDLNYIKQSLDIGSNSGLVWTRPEDCFLSDADLKEKLFTDPRTIYGNFDLTLAMNLGKLFFIDDLEANCLVGEKLGLQTIHAV